MDSPLSSPWSDNITTFAEALNTTLAAAPYDKPLPPVMSTLDRCWCDFWGGGFFDPYNVSQWERSSVLKLADELERERKEELAALAAEKAEPDVKEEETTAATKVEAMPRTAAPPSPSARVSPIRGVAAHMWSVVHPYIQSARAIADSSRPLFKMDNVTAPPEPVKSLPPLRREYDLRPYGLGVIVDFGWTRSS